LEAFGEAVGEHEQEDDEEGERQRIDDVDDAHHHGVGLAARVAPMAPQLTPMTSETTVAASATASEMRQPKRTRAKTSCPSRSVPNQWCALRLGGWNCP
jgi:hypothetical protein